MFGIKTRISNYLRYHKKDKFSNDWQIWRLMKAFKADEIGHQANINEANLGYGWIHYGLIRQQKPKTLLCVGSRYGYIPAVMAQACKDNGFGKVHFVDAGYGESNKNHWTGVGYWKTNDGLACFKKFGLNAYITTHVMTTRQYAVKYKLLKYDYIYIDGDHSFSGVSLDYKLLYPRLNSGGYMMFHDICVKRSRAEGIYGVWKLWSKLQNNHKNIQINNPLSGLGIIQK